MGDDYAAGFRSVQREFTATDLEATGDLPEWLRGSLIRNGPGRFEVGGERVDHWFDGLAMLSRFAFTDAGVTYTNRFLRSHEYRAATRGGSLPGGQFGTDRRGLLDRLRDVILPTPTDNANVNVLRVGDRYVAITETQVGIEFDPETLATRGRYRFTDLDGQLMTAHPLVDPVTGDTFTFTTELGRTSRYHVYRHPSAGEGFRRVGSINADRPAYVHSFSLTASHVVIVECPLVVNPFRLLLPTGGSFIEQYRWRPDRGTRFTVMDRETGDVVARHITDPFFAFHHANAFDDDGSVVVDIATFAGPDILDSLYLDELAAGGPPALDAALKRFRVPVGPGNPTTQTLSDDGVTLPRFSPDRTGRPHRFVYGQGPPSTDAVRPHRLVKIDARHRRLEEWHEAGTFCGEPVFVPAPDTGDEDNGVLLSVVLETARDRSSLLVLDASTMTELARTPLPHITPFDFHGTYFPADHRAGDGDHSTA